MRRSLKLENECADIVAAAGYRVHQNPTAREIAEARRLTGDTGDPRKFPDYLIEGHVFDCYAPTRLVEVRSVWAAVGKKVRKGQTQREVVYLADWDGDLTGLRRQFEEWPISGLKELILIMPNGTIRQMMRRD